MHSYLRLMYFIVHLHGQYYTNFWLRCLFCSNHRKFHLIIHWCLMLTLISFRFFFKHNNSRHYSKYNYFLLLKNRTPNLKHNELYHVPLMIRKINKNQVSQVINLKLQNIEFSLSFLFSLHSMTHLSSDYTIIKIICYCPTL